MQGRASAYEEGDLCMTPISIAVSQVLTSLGAPFVGTHIRFGVYLLAVPEGFVEQIDPNYVVICPGFFQRKAHLYFRE